MHYVDLQRTDCRCESVIQTTNYQQADAAYRSAIDSAGPDVANISWYFNLGSDQQHIGSRVFRALD